MTWTWDVRAEIIECNNVYLTQRSARDKGVNGIFKMSPDEFYSGVYPDDLDRLRDKMEALASGEGQPVDEEIRYLDDTGENYIWIEIYAITGKTDPVGKPIYLIGGNCPDPPTQADGAGIEGQSEGRGIQPVEIRLPSEHEPRDTYPAERYRRLSNLLAETCHSEETREFCEIIETNNELLLQLVNDILDLSKIEAGQMDFIYSEFNVSTLFRSLYQTFQGRVKDGVTLYCEIPEQDRVIYSEKNRLTQVITNFLTNACKFTFQGSIRMGYKEREDGLYFYVKDTGKGIERKNLPHVFERFANSIPLSKEPDSDYPFAKRS